MGAEVSETEVFIVGGGPAGLAAAIALRQHGLRTVVADFARPPIDKACGEGLMPNTVTALRELGVTFPPGQTIPFRGIRFIEAGTSADGSFPRGYGLGVRRTTLHSALVERAAAAGAQLLWGTRVTGLARREVFLGTRRIRSRWIVGADGQNSLVRKWAGLNRAHPREIRFGFRQHYGIAPWTDFVEVHWGRDSQIVITAVSPTEVCLVVTSRSPQLRLKEALKHFPEVSQRLEGSPVLTQDLGAISALRIMRTVWRDPFILIGDASGSVDSLTGEGLGLAFQQARALAKALANHDPSSYQAAHRRINRGPEGMSKLLLLMEGRAWLRRRVLRTLASEPRLFARLLGAHVEAFSPAAFGFWNFLKLGRGLLAGSG